MSNLLLGLPPNVYRKTASDIVLKFPGVNVIPPRTHQEDHEFMQELFCERTRPCDRYPDIIISPDPEVHGNHKWIEESGYFEEFNSTPQKLSLYLSSYIEPAPCRCVTIIGVIPVIIIFNKNSGVSVSSWSDLYNVAQKGRIVTPPEDTPLPDIYRYYIRKVLGDKAPLVFEKTDHLLYPLDINKAVDEGRYDAGVLIPAFSRNSRLGNIRTCYPAEGIIGLPVAVLQRKGRSKITDGIVDYFLSDEYQEFLSSSGDMIPVSGNVSLPEGITADTTLIWEGWELFEKLMYPDPALIL